jgi:hypothetical protein
LCSRHNHNPPDHIGLGPIGLAHLGRGLIAVTPNGEDSSMTSYANPYGRFDVPGRHIQEQIVKMLEHFSKMRVQLQVEQAAAQTALQEQIDRVGKERAERGFVGKRLCIELMDGKHDGMVFDSQSGDPTERELVRLLRFSSNFEQVQKVETDTEVFVQLRPKRGDTHMGAEA